MNHLDIQATVTFVRKILYLPEITRHYYPLICNNAEHIHYIAIFRYYLLPRECSEKQPFDDSKRPLPSNLGTVPERERVLLCLSVYGVWINLNQGSESVINTFQERNDPLASRPAAAL